MAIAARLGSRRMSEFTFRPIPSINSPSGGAEFVSVE